jgi:hypothetical protein
VALLGLSSDTWVGFVGAVLGGGATYLTQRTSDRAQSRAKERDEKKPVSATALLIQDDFLHYQSRLARCLDGCRWWVDAEELPTQATVEDRKIVWAELGDDDTRCVADAQGWMDYLKGCRKMRGEQPVSLSKEDISLMRMVFRSLEQGRKALADLAHRKATRFEDSPVLKELKSNSVEELLTKGN